MWLGQSMNESLASSVHAKSGAELTKRILPATWAARKKIFVISTAAGLIALGVNFLLPVYYKASATLLPETQKEKLSTLGQFADIAQLAGMSVPGSEIARLYPVIVFSETILRKVIADPYKTATSADSVNLIQYFDLNEGSADKNMAKALEKVRGLMSAGFDNKTSVVTLTMEMPEPQLAADVLNGIVRELDTFMRSKKTTNASEQANWISERLQGVEKELRLAEETLKNFKENNRRIADSPDLLMRQDRLVREVQVKSAIYVELKKQYELARIDEIKNITIVNILDQARPPVKKERPKRATNSALTFILSFLVLCGYYAFSDLYGDKISAFVRASAHARQGRKE